MPQVRKAEVAAAIDAAALRSFARHGYTRTTVAGIAAAAGTATANVYRYHRTKQDLFDAVVPSSLLAEHDALLDARVEALAAGSLTGPDAWALLDFWLDHRLQTVILLDRAEGTPYSGYPAHFVGRLVDQTVTTLATPPGPDHLALLDLVFDNTRRAIAAILGGDTDRARTGGLIEGFWSYQVPGLAGLASWHGTRVTTAPAGRRRRHR